MHAFALFSAFLVAIASAAPVEKRETYHGVSLYVHQLNTFTGVVYQGPASAEIAKLTKLGGEAMFKLSFDKGVAVNVDINSVECQAYKDTDGVEPIGGPITAEQPVVYSAPEEPVVIRSILCYVK